MGFGKAFIAVSSGSDLLWFGMSMACKAGLCIQELHVHCHKEKDINIDQAPAWLYQYMLSNILMFGAGDNKRGVF